MTANEAHPTVAGLDRAYVAENPSEPWEDWYAERVTDEFAAWARRYASLVPP